MKMKTFVAASIAAGMLICVAQQPPDNGAPKQQQANTPLPKTQYKFTDTTTLVIVDVNVKDRNGKPIENLKASDFTVSEDGKPQTVKVFEYQRLEETLLPPPPAPALQERKAEPEAPKVAAAVQNSIAPARPGEIKYRNRRLLALYFDFQGMPSDDQIRVQANAQKFLKTQMTPSDLVAIMSYTGELKVLQDFTDDRDAALKIISKLVIGTASEMGNTVSDDSTEDTGAAFTADDSEFNIFNTDRQMASLENAVKMLGVLPEAKALVYFGSGISRSGIDNDAQLRATINSALKSNVKFYPVDARGLVATSPVGNASQGSSGGGGRGSGGNYSGSAAGARQSNMQGSQDTLYALANDTGGKLFVDSSDLSAGIVQAQKDISSYYILGYYTTNPALDGKFRRINVKLAPTLSAKLDYRPGYFANKQFKNFNSSDRERQLQDALALGDPVTDLSLALETDYFRLRSDAYVVPMSVKMPGTDLVLAKHGGAQSTRLDFIGEIRNSKNVPVRNVRDFINVKLNEDTAAQLAKRTIAYDTTFVLEPGSYTIKFLTRENETGKMGTFETKFVIPDLSTDNKYLPISSVVLSNQREKVTNAVANLGGPMRMMRANPLVQNDEKLIPSVTRVFRKDQEMYVFLEAYEPTAADTEPLVATLSFYRGNVKAFESEPLRVMDGLKPDTKAVPLRFSIPLAKFEPGNYTCQVSVLSPTAQRFAFWRARVTLLP
jgi:VWFA-related protein